MKLNPQAIPSVFGEFLDSQIAPRATGMQKFGAYAMQFVINAKLPEIVQRYTPIMKMTGLMGDDGMIDIEYAHGMASAAIAKAEKVNVLGYILDASDIENIYAIAQRHGQ